jgi:putative redox protein
MVSIKARYNGDLTCTATHLKNGIDLNTDAPIDNNGKGSTFSPTDLLCTSLATCMMTLMGITANAKGIQLGRIDVEIEKIMASDPRRVSGINLQFVIENTGFEHREMEILKNAALTCPVAKSIHSEIKVNAVFNFE